MKKLALTVCLLAVLSVAAPYAMGQSTPDKASPLWKKVQQSGKLETNSAPLTIEQLGQPKTPNLHTPKQRARLQKQELANQNLLLAVLEKRTEDIENLIVLDHADIHYTLPQTENPSDLSQKILKTLYEKRAEFDFFKEISIYDVSPAVAAKAMGIEIKPRGQYTLAEKEQLEQRWREKNSIRALIKKDLEARKADQVKDLHQHEVK